MHRHQRIVKFRLDLSAFRPFAAKDVLQDLKMRVRITQLEPEQHRHQPADDRPKHPCQQELLADHLMVLAEYIFGNKGFMMGVHPMLIEMHVMTGFGYRM